MNYRNKKLRESANGETCVACGAQDGTVIWAHSNEQRHGKGMGIKAHDLFGAYLCHRCHSDYDQGKVPSPKAKFREWWEASMIRACGKGIL